MPLAWVEYLSEGWPYALSVAIGGIAGFFISQVKDVSEIRKLKAEKANLEAETVTHAATLLEKIQEARDQYREACVSCTAQATLLLDLMKRQSEPAEVDSAREVLCSLFLENAIPCFLKYSEWEHLRKKQVAGKLENFLRNDVCKELRMFAEWLSIVNYEPLLDKIGRRPARVHKKTLQPFLDPVDDLPRENQRMVRTCLVNEINKIIEGGPIE